MLDSKPLTMVIDSKKKKSKENSSKTLDNGRAKSRKILLSSIAAFLESIGFVKTLSVLRSEAQIEFESDGLNVSSINNEDLLFKLLESSIGHEEAAIDWRKETDSQKTHASTKDEIEHDHDAFTQTHKKKRKHRKETDDGTNPVAEELGLDKNSNGVNNLCDSNDLENFKSAEDLSFEIKDKKKKKKSHAVSLEENADKNHLESSCGIAENGDHGNILPNTDVNVKAKKKKKHKMSADGCNEKTECGDHAKIQQVVEEKGVTQNTLINTSSSLLAESNAKHKGEKKRKRKVESVSLSGNGEECTEEDCKESETIKEKAVTSKNVHSTDMKAHKKRKKLESEERASYDENGTMGKDPKHVKLEAASLQEQDPCSQDIQKEQSAPQLATDALAKNQNEGRTASKSKKKGNHSAEPKTTNVFQRVKIDEVKFADERLQNNSYWALDGTGSGYGAKAQEVLGQVRGRDFRHEKTKKKRGTYRGGQIDLQSHSIKFNYLDAE